MQRRCRPKPLIVAQNSTAFAHRMEMPIMNGSQSQLPSVDDYSIVMTVVFQKKSPGHISRDSSWQVERVLQPLRERSLCKSLWLFQVQRCGDVLVPLASSLGATTAAATSSAIDGFGRLTGARSTGGSHPGTTSFSYDRLDRLTQVRQRQLSSFYQHAGDSWMRTLS